MSQNFFSFLPHPFVPDKRQQETKFVMFPKKNIEYCQKSCAIDILSSRALSGVILVIHLSSKFMETKFWSLIKVVMVMYIISSSFVFTVEIDVKAQGWGCAN